VPVAGPGNPVQAGVAYPQSASRGGENFVLLDGEVVVAQHTDSDAAPCERGPAVERLSGPDRYATAARIALRFYQEAAVVYLASGETFPDALAAGGIPDVEDGPVLLTQRDTLPEATREALANLNVAHLRVLGGPAAISDAVVAQAREAAGLAP
jgi:putative cell wall-binding protein